MEATSSVTSIQAIPDEESFKQSENIKGEQPPRYISPSTRMETRLILKSLGGTSTTVTPHRFNDYLPLAEKEERYFNKNLLLAVLN